MTLDDLIAGLAEGAERLIVEGDAARAEIARLTADRDDWRAMWTSVCAQRDEANNEAAMARRVLARLMEPSPVFCACGRPVETARRCYAIPTCYACLPPPPPLPVGKIGGAP